MHSSLSHGYALSITRGNFPCFAVGDAIERMQTAFETRKARLLLLKKKYGTWSAINRLLGWESTNPRLSQIGSGAIRSGRNTPYFMGDELARELEKALGLETGWMDTPPGWAELHGQQDPRTKVMALMEAMPSDQWPTVVRLLDAFAQPAKPNGTTGH